MTKQMIEPMDWLRKQLESGNDVVKGAVEEMVHALMNAEAQVLCGAGYGERTGQRENSRNGYRERPWDTRLGSMTLRIPKLRQGSYFPQWLLQPRRRAEQALVAVITEAYVQGVSTRKVEDLVQALGVEHLSKSQVSTLCQQLDEVVSSFRERKLTANYCYVWLDALVLKCREGGRIVNTSCLVAVGVSSDGRREVLGLEVVTEEDGASWTAFLRSLVARGLKGVKLVISDAHAGLVNAIAATMTGASWQRCRTHFMRNVLMKVPRSHQTMVGALIRSVFAQPDAKEVREQYARVIEQLKKPFPGVAAMLREAQEELLAFTPFPKAHWKQIWSNNPQERLNKELRRRTDVVGVFPHRDSIVRLVGAVLVEQNDEWAVVRRYMTFEVEAEKEALEVRKAA